MECSKCEFNNFCMMQIMFKEITDCEGASKPKKSEMVKENENEIS